MGTPETNLLIEEVNHLKAQLTAAEAREQRLEELVNLFREWAEWGIKHGTHIPGRRVLQEIDAAREGGSE